MTPTAARLMLLAFLLVGCDQADSLPDLENARELIRLGKFEEAVAPLTRLHYEDPADYEICHLYGLALLETNNAGMAVWPLRAAARMRGHELEDGLLLARALSTSAVPMDALEVVDGLLERAPNEIALWSLRAKVNQSLRFDEEALSDCEVMLELDENRADAVLCQIDSLIKLDRPEEAEAIVLEGLRRLEEAESAPAFMKARFCQKSAELAQALHSEEETADRWVECAGKFPRAIDLVKQAVEYLDASGRGERADRLLREAVDAEASEFALVEALAARYEAQGDEASAQAVLEQATSQPGIARTAWIALADFHRRRDRFEPAILAMERSMADQEELPVLLVAQYADDLIQAGRFEAAELTIERLPDHPMVAFLRGRIQLLEGDAEAALATLAEGLELWPDNTTARFLAGEAAYALGDVDRAISEYRDSLRSGAGFTRAPIRLARIHEAEGNLSAALIALAHRSKDIPDDIETRRELLRIARRARRPDVAQEQIAALAKISGTQEIVAVESALNTASFMGIERAIGEIRESGADLDAESNADLLSVYVEFLVDSGAEEEALDSATRAVEANPDDPRFLEILAMALSVSNDARADARGALSRAVELAPERPTALRGLALLTDDPAEAVALFDRAQENNDEDQRDAWQAVSRLDAVRGDEAEIAARLESIVRADPTHASAAAKLSRMMAANPGNMDRAILLADRAMRFGGGPEAFLLRAELAKQVGDTATVRRILGRIDAARPPDPAVQLAVAEGFLDVGDTRRARRLLERLRDSDDPGVATSAADVLERMEGFDAN